MQVPKDELVAVLSQFNPWWRDEAIPDIPGWRRAAFRDLHGWLTAPPAPRAVLLSGARQIGKTTLMLQAADALLRSGVPSANLLYATFDHPIIKLAGVDAVLEAWREREPKAEGPEYLLLDEAQFITDPTTTGSPPVRMGCPRMAALPTSSHT
jgi:predicted AAA+ superfamily ATPase